MLAVSLALNGQSLNPSEYYTNIFKSSKTVLNYKIVDRNDSTFMMGELIERNSRQPIMNMNIELVGYRIGTVPDIGGKFRLWLPQKDGVVRFIKDRFDEFEVPYTSKVGR